MATFEEAEPVSVRLERLAAGRPDVATLFSGIAALSADLFGIDGRISCALTLIRNDRPVTVSFSDPQALSWDETQRFAGDGPCLEAMRTGLVVVTGDLRTESRWPAYLRLVAGREVLAIMGAPLTLPGGSQGVLNFYSPTENRFGTAEREAARLFAAQISLCLVAAMQISAWAKTAQTVMVMVDSRSVINAAVGVVMGTRKITSDDAFHHLSALADSSHRSIRAVSNDILRSLDPL